MRDRRKFCRPKITKSPQIGDIIIQLKCGEEVVVNYKEFLSIKDFFKIKSIVGSKNSAETGDILTYNSILDQTSIFNYENWSTLNSDWKIYSISGVEIINQSDIKGGEYIISSNNTTLIINPKDFSKVADNWHFEGVEGNFNEKALVVLYNVTDTVNATPLFNNREDITDPSLLKVHFMEQIQSMKIDGDTLLNPTDEYTFSTPGIHIVEYILGNDAEIYDNTFYLANSDISYSIVQMIIPNNVVKINEYSFYDSDTTKAILIESGLTEIDSWAFSRLTGLDNIICKAITPPSVRDSSFTSISGSIYVPSNSLNAYKNTSGWPTLRLKSLL